jgi:DNA-binding protein HU-beta
MNRKELITAIATDLGLSQKLVTEMLKAFIKTVTITLKKGNVVNITGFGSFRVSKRSARSCVLPQDTSKLIKIPALKTPSFRAGKTLKEQIR